jgi:GH24 family phage-related lysozyme (muramidase)
MERILEIYSDGRVYEMEGARAVKVTETHGQIDALIEALQFTLATTFTVAPPEKQPPALDFAERRGSRHINPEGFKLLTTFEGCKLIAYDDGAGVWTIGYGHTKNVHQGTSITQAQAEQLLREDLEKFESFVEDAVKVSVNDARFSALVCFCFNVGPGKNGLGGSTLLKLLNQDDFQGAANEFPRWNKVNGQPWLGLTRRRLAEQALFLGQPWKPFLNYQETTLRVLKLTEPAMKGEDVRQLQEALNRVGANIKVDGIFGVDTDKVLRQFQQQKGLAGDGIAGAVTQKALGL